jgi:uncharacterized protein YciI
MSETRLFAVVRTRGGAWKPGLPVEQQFDWRGHAAFMDKLYEEGFVILAGPLEGTEDALIMVRAKDPEEIRRKLEWDSWTANDLLRTTRSAPWNLRLGSIGPSN